MWLFSKSASMPAKSDALPGRPTPILRPGLHRVLGTPIAGPYPEGFEVAEFALGCFWGEELAFWQEPGVWTTAVGYEGGYTPNATYQEVCSGRTGHAEAVRVVFDPSKTSYEALLRVFWASHDPTQGMRQGNDVGTQYRSAIFVRDEGQRVAAEASKAAFQHELSAAGYGDIQTEIVGPQAPEFFFAEDYHEQYLVVHPNGYCPVHATGVTLPASFSVPVAPLQYAD